MPYYAGRMLASKIAYYARKFLRCAILNWDEVAFFGPKDGRAEKPLIG